MSMLHLKELESLTLDRLVRAHRDVLSFAVASATQIQPCPGNARRPASCSRAWCNRLGRS